MKKAVFCDMDETLLVNWHVPEVNRDAIQKVRKKGVRFIPCSGRPPFMMEDLLKEMDLWDCENEYYICLNGGMVLESKGNKVLYYNGLSLEETDQALKLAEKMGSCVMVVTNRCFHIFHPLESEIRRKTNQQTVFALYDHYDVYAVDALKQESISKLMFVSDFGVEGFKEVSKTFPEEILENYEITFSSGRFMEFNKKGVSKGNGVQFLSDYLKIDVEDVIAIGDSTNDISMLKKAGLGACVASADPDVKAISGYVTQRDYMDGAVAEVLEKFIL